MVEVNVARQLVYIRLSRLDLSKLSLGEELTVLPDHGDLELHITGLRSPTEA